MWLGSGTAVAVAVAVAGSCSSDRPLAWEPTYAIGVALKRKKKRKKVSLVSSGLFSKEFMVCFKLRQTLGQGSDVHRTKINGK